VAASEDLLEIVNILNAEGFGALAGELLIEVNVGRELSDDVGADDVTEVALTGKIVRLDDDRNVEQRFFDTTEGLDASEVRREPIPASEQMRFAAEFLRMKLVDPVRAWAEAEKMAGDLTIELTRFQQAGSVRGFRSPRPVRIEFAERPEEGVPRLSRDAVPGSIAGTKKLEAALAQLSALEV